MLKSNKQKPAVKRNSSRNGENGSGTLTKRLINKNANEFSVMVVIQQFYVKEKEAFTIEYKLTTQKKLHVEGSKTMVCLHALYFS